MQSCRFEVLPVKISLKNKTAVLVRHDAKTRGPCDVLPLCCGGDGGPLARFGLRYPCSSLLQKRTALLRHLAVSRSDGKASPAMVGGLRPFGDFLAAFLFDDVQ